MVFTSVTDRSGQCCGQRSWCRLRAFLGSGYPAWGNWAQPCGKNRVYHLFGGQFAEPRAHAAALGGK